MVILTCFKFFDYTCSKTNSFFEYDFNNSTSFLFLEKLIISRHFWDLPSLLFDSLNSFYKVSGILSSIFCFPILTVMKLITAVFFPLMLLLSTKVQITIYGKTHWHTNKFIFLLAADCHIYVCNIFKQSSTNYVFIPVSTLFIITLLICKGFMSL